MVFIELKSSYLRKFNSSPGMMTVINYILNQTKTDLQHGDLQSLEIAVNSLIRAVLDKDENLFTTIEEEYKRKTPDSFSPWINNDYLIFLMSIGQQIFQKDKVWLRNAIAMRKQNDDETRLIVEFLYAILSNAPYSTGKIAPLQLVYIYLTTPTSIAESTLNSCIGQLNRIETFPCFKNEFLNILYIGAFQIELKLKGMIDVDNTDRVNFFLNHSQKRVSSLANIAVYVVFITMLIGIFLFIKYVFLVLSENWKNAIIATLGVAGITILEIFKGRKPLKRWIEKKISAFWGFTILNSR